MQPPRRQKRFQRGHVIPRRARARRTVTQIQRSKTGIIRRILQNIGRPQRFIHHVCQMAEVPHVLRAVSVQHGAHRAPHAGLCVAAHAVRAQQAAGIANAPVHAGAARPVQQPRVHLGHLIVHGHAHGLPRVRVRAWTPQTQLHIVARGICFHLQEINPTRLQQPVNLRPVPLGLLMNPFVRVRAFPVFLAIAGVKQNLRNN